MSNYIERWLKVNGKFVHVVFTNDSSYVDGVKVEDNKNLLNHDFYNM